MSGYPQAKTARDRNKKTIRVGDSIRYLGYGEVMIKTARPVKVVAIRKQGADGTILTTEPAPNPDYPHHFGCRASQTEVVL